MSNELVLMNDERHLPASLEDLAQFVLVGREKLAMVRAGIRALDKLDVAEGVRRQKKEEAQMLAEALLDAEVKIGEILARMPKAKNQHQSASNSGVTGTSTKEQAIKELGFDKMQVSRFQTLAANKDLVEEVKQAAKDADDLPTRTAVLQLAKIRERDIDLQRRKNEFAKEADTSAAIITKCFIGDCIDGMASANIEKSSILLSDPPYGMDYKSNRRKEKFNKIDGDKLEDTASLLDAAFAEAKKHLKEDAHIYIFGNPYMIEDIRPVFEKHFVLKNILIWDRGVIGVGDLSTYGRSFDIIYFGYYKEWKPLNGIRDRDVISFNRMSPGNMTHPTEKPTDLLEYIIKKSSNEGDFVLDPFAGSCSTLRAAKNTGRNAYGFELKKEYVPTWLI